MTPTCLIVLPALSIVGRSDEPAEVAGYGPIDFETAMRHAGEAGCWTRVFTDPTTGALTGIDAHAERIPTSWRCWLTLRDGTCRAPGCSRSAATCDVDHTIRREHGGPTASDNLSCLCRTHHQVKDDGCWDLTLHPDGTQQWRSIWGSIRTTKPDVLVGVQPRAAPPPTATARIGDPPGDDCPF